MPERQYKQINFPVLSASPFLKYMEYPNATKHFYVSILKSVVRIGGYTLIPFNIVAACITLVISELIGIIEELV